jgi:4-aminobutyrate aminotransferase / (S)-3-amino-2-methylpropionate transaminase / 5-aminovalerate transaminase
MSAGIFDRTPRTVDLIETAYRRISTQIPAPGTEDLLAVLDANESRSMHGQMPLVWDRAHDFSIYDRAGNRFIDFTSTIFVANTGHGNRAVRDAVRAVLDQGLLHSYAYASEIRASYLERLVEFAPAPVEKAMLFSSGTEAVEAAFKLMRMHGQKVGKKRLGVICLKGNYHGRTMAAQMLGGGDDQRSWMGDQDQDVHRIDFPFTWELDGMSGAEYFHASIQGLKSPGLASKKLNVEESICGLLLEGYQGWNAAFYPTDYVTAAADWCRENNVLLAFDEIQSGFGRTGRKFCFEHYGVEPDLICCGKGMGSGVALSGVLGRAEIMDLPDIGNMSSTNSANPMACAAGLATIKEIERLNLIAESERKGKILRRELMKLQSGSGGRISRISARGLVAALVFDDEACGGSAADFADGVCLKALESGLLLVRTGRESIKIGPPLTIADGALEEGLEVLGSAIADVAWGTSR